MDVVKSKVLDGVRGCPSAVVGRLRGVSALPSVARGRLEEPACCRWGERRERATPPHGEEFSRG
eukprot:2348004-Alexandrium_andersonii.AAC.1